MEKKKVLLVDGMALLFRAFYATAVSNQFMYNEAGVPTNGVQGFVKHLLTAIDEHQSDYVGVCWDLGGGTFRNEMWGEYKAHRSAPPAELIPQFDYAKEIADALGFVNISCQGYEADDCLGTLADHYRHEGVHTTIVTGDKDILQLVDTDTDVWILQKGYGNYKKYDPITFVNEWEIQPKQLIDLKAFMGDTADGYPGVKGIGEKTATTLIKTYGDVKTVIDHVTELPKGQMTKIQTDLEMLKMSLQLAEIHIKVPITVNLADLFYRGFSEDSLGICDYYGLKVVRRELAKLLA
ncbi:5'-3' exonuclease [Brochothrix campestris]|uniref:5'-3' exonuclease n=1 Tax=Brochothrix campestris FSL F6-1037 TaxID=1265861 RepID=W7CTQ1_9LIST|nr:5'-3' exonuclease [Brochothrix campestris]EUJ36313.1 5'-3' exonuclease [Brochothrix campestris FSL F6-1037]